MFNNLFGQEKDKGDAITTAHEKYLPQAAARGRSLALNKNLPMLIGDNIELYIAPTRAEYEGLLAQNIRPLGGDHRQLAEAEKQNLMSKNESLTKQADQNREVERKLILERDALSHTNYKRTNKKLLYFIILILALGDALVSRPALSIFTANSNLVEFLVLIMLTAFYIILPLGIVITFRATEESGYKHAIRIVAVVVILGGLFVLANMRSIYLQQIGTTTMADVKATTTVPMKVWYFIGLNLFFLFASTICVYMAGTTAENQSLDRAKEIDTKLSEVRAEIRRCEQEAQGIPDRIYASERQWSQRQAEIDNMKSRINSLFMQAVSAFISENMLHRKNEDGRPSCFDEPVRPLS